jgi:RNA polymerase sigma-70 factor (ECF subfamily)
MEKAVSNTEASTLLNDLRTGNPDSFEKVVEQYQRPIIRYLYRLTGDYQVAQDLAQDTFFNAYKNIHKTDPDLKLGAWLYRIATNNALQYHRRKKILGFIPFEAIGKSGTKGNGAHPEDPVEDMAIRDTLSKIPYQQRVCLVLYYIEGYKCREIADALEVSEAAVRKRISRAVKSFRRIYKGGTK